MKVSVRYKYICLERKNPSLLIHTEMYCAVLYEYEYMKIIYSCCIVLEVALHYIALSIKLYCVIL